ncbi:hypothetical protein [Clostridium sp. KNHs216]|uniref:hypothetical protein n=1 Tax=Clostridium sp. KNHs216 TaxID=1550235 RepID=UPI0011543EE6|nr:hypothetical protein [Clostridium sp. KNHs216]TQI65413.1 hypothetical protein LY85_0046 [Clostridium sp. KNHs216]
MPGPSCKYRQPGYWEWTLGKQDVWNDLFVPPEQLETPVFINACAVDGQRLLLDSNWACHPGIESVLGFVQYVFLPTVCYYVLHPKNGRLMTPVQSPPELLETIRRSDSPHRLAMSGFVYELSAVWRRSAETQWATLGRFCDRFNRYWECQDVLFSLNVFPNVEKVVFYLKEQVWCEELFQEEFGYTYSQLDELCRRFETEPFAKYLFLNWLNTRAGCLV